MRVSLPHITTLLSFAMTGCAAITDDNHEDHWRRAKILAISRSSDLPSDADVRCVQSAKAGADTKIVILQYRLGRTQYARAFAAPEGALLKVGDTLHVNPLTCSLK